jgi:hypothetical protein
MKQKRFFAGILAMALAMVALALAGCNTLQSIEISKEPTRLVFGQGQQLDTSGLAVMAYYKKDSRAATGADLRFSGYNPGTPGKQTVTVTMEDKSATFTVTVIPVVKLTIQQPPAAKAFMQGDDFNPAGLVALVEFENGTVPGEKVGPAQPQLKFSGYSKDKGGVQTVTADYYDKKATFDVRVASLTSIAVTSPPDNTQYFTGEDLDLMGLVVTGTWEGVGERPVSVTQGSLSSFDKNRAGKQDVFVTYQGKTASFPVTFVGMQSLSIFRPPAKLNYGNGAKLDINGLEVQGTRMGATSIELVDVSRLKISGYDRFKGGNQTITVTLGGKTATFRVTVAPNPFVGTWHGTYIRKNSQGVVEVEASVTLIMSEDSWSVTIPKAGKMSWGYEFSGTYTRDTDSGRHAKLLLNKGDSTFAPGAADILSYSELKLSESRGAFFASGGLTLTKAR